MTPTSTPEVYRLFLPLVARAPVPELIVTLNEESVAEQSVTQGAIFATRLVAIPTELPKGMDFYLSSSPDALTPSRVDDRIVLKVDGMEVFQYTYGLPPSPLMSEPARPYVVISSLVRIPDVVMQQLAGNTISVEFVDVYGVYGSATPIFIVTAPR